MIDSDIYKYVTQFKSAIIRARDDGLFDKDISFYRFPRACCGDACYLLAEYLCARGIETIYVWGDYKRQSHAWLVVKDQRVKIPIKKQIINVNYFLDLAKKYYDIQKLDCEIIRTFIEKVIVHKAEKVDGKRCQRIEIKYIGIGSVSIPN